MKKTRIPIPIGILKLLLAATTVATAADPPPEFIAAAEKRRAEIPLGGDFKPDPKAPVFIAVGHGGRILLSWDDGKNWQQVFWGHPGSDHGMWACKSVAYSDGVFVVPVGWGAITSYLASEDGLNWRHLTDGSTTLAGVKEASEDSTAMPMTFGVAGGKGAFVATGYMGTAATADFGKTLTTFSLREFKTDPRPRKLVTHHVSPVYCGDESGRFLALGNDRSTENTVFGNLFASDDLGKTWTWLEPQLLNEQCDGYSGMACNGDLVVIADKSGENVFVSNDAGDTWGGPFATGTSRASLSMVNGEFWLVAKSSSRTSADGKTWRDLAEGIPEGKIVASPAGTLISIQRRRSNILRSDDGGNSWHEVYTFEPETEHVHGAQGLRDIVFGYVRE